MAGPTKRKKVWRLGPKDVRTIVTVIDDIDPRIRPTWQHVEGAALTATRHAFTRQALSKHAEIVAAYGAKVAQHREVARTGKPPRPKGDEEWDRQKEAMLGELERLKARVAALDEAHVRHVANAIRLGIAQRELERPTEKLAKGATDKAGKPKVLNGGRA